MLTSGDVDYALCDLDPDRAGDVAEITELHYGLLQSGISGLGTRFLRDFFYNRMVRDGLVRAALCRVDGRPAGFISMTPEPGSFLSTTVRNHWPTVTWQLLPVFLRQPTALLRLLKLLRLNVFRVSPSSQNPQDAARILAIGVLPEYRSPRFVQSTGIRIAPDLVGHAVSWSRQLGLRELYVEVEADDRPLLVFYRLLGWQSEQYLSDSRIPMIKVYLDLGQLGDSVEMPELGSG